MKDCHKDYNYRILSKGNIWQRSTEIPPMAIPRSTQRSAVWPAAIRMLINCQYKAREIKRYGMRNAYLLAKT